MTASEIRIPTLDECRFEPIEVATPKDRLDASAELEARIRGAAHGRMICWPPDGDDSFTVRGEGGSRLEAYRDLLSELVTYSYEQCDNDAEIANVWTRIRKAMEAVSGD